MQRLVTWCDTHQVALYLAAILLGVVIGVLVPGAAATFAVATNPVLGLLLFATFLGVPLIEVGRSFWDLRFLGTLLVVNFVVVPIVVFGLSRFVADDRGLLIGVLMVLLTPCVDYVIVFTGLAAYSAQQLKVMAVSVPEDRHGSYSVVGALSLYITFINLFLMLLRVLGGRRN